MKTDSDIIKECGDDAAKWARAFALALVENPSLASDEAAMRGWFANAIESRARTSRQNSPEKP